MKHSFSKTTDKILSVVLALMLIISIMPISAFASTENNADVFTFTVKDETGTPVKDASVYFAISVDDVTATDGNIVTDENGEAVVEAMADYAEAVSGDESSVAIIYTVSKDGYETVEEVSAAVTDVTADIGVTLTEEKIMYTVSADENIENGTVTFGEDKAASVTVEAGSSVSFTITAIGNYRIASVNGSALESDVAEYTGLIESVDEDTVITAEFVRYYTVSVTYSPENGAVVVGDDEEYTGDILVKDEGIFSLTATPKTGYRVAAVKLNDADVDFDGKGQNDVVYSTGSVTPEDDCKYEITFAKNKYIVSIVDVTNGKVSTDHSDRIYEYGDKPVITITPNSGYALTAASYGNADIWDQLSPKNDGNANEYTAAEGISGDVTVTVSFTEAEKGKATLNYDKAKRIYKDEATSKYHFVYAINDTAVFSVLNDSGFKGIRINEDRSTGIAFNTPTWSIDKNDTKNKTVTKIETYKGYSWVDAAIEYNGIQLTDNIILEFDGTAPVPAFGTVKDFYNDDALIEVNAKDEQAGLDEIKYTLKADGVDDVTGIFSANGTAEKFTDTINVSAEKYNNKKVTLSVTAVDKAGNETSSAVTESFFISTDVPEITVSASGRKDKNAAADKNAYNDNRTISIEVSNNPIEVFSAENLESVVSVLKDGKKYFPAFSVSGSKVSFTLNEEGAYEWTIGGYENKAGTAAADVQEADDSENTFSFTIDKRKPEVEIATAKTTWSAIKEKITFGLWNNSEFIVEATATDKASAEDVTVSGIQSVLYYKYSYTPDEDGNYIDLLADCTTSKEQYDKLTAIFADEKNEISDSAVKVNSDETFVVYARVTDNAGNVTFVSTDGLIFDGTAGTLTTEYLDANEYGFYNDDVTFDVSVKENIVNDSYSGIAEVTYTVIKDAKYNAETKTWEGTTTADNVSLYKFAKSSPAHKDLVTEFSEEKENVLSFTVDAAKNNSDSVVVIVKAKDNANNEFKTVENVISINTNTPVVNVEFNDFDAENDGSEKLIPVTGNYYRTTGDNKCVAKVYIVNDRLSAFNEEAISVNLNKQFTPLADLKEDETAEYGFWFTAVTDSESAAGNNTVKLEEGDVTVEWSEVSYNDEDVKCATITFNKDAHYTWGFNYKDKADNEVKDIIGDDDNTFDFVSDSTAPRGSVTVNRNIWKTLLSVITFGIYDEKEFIVSAASEDETSKTYISYYISTGKGSVSSEALEKLYTDENTPFADYTGEIKLESDRTFVVFVRISDDAGNYIYICSDGHIIDDTDPYSELSVNAVNRYVYDEEKGKAFGFENENEGNIDVVDPDTIYGIYNGDIVVDVESFDGTASEKAEDANYSGIKQISYSIEKDGEVVQNGVLFDFLNDFSAFPEEKVTAETEATSVTEEATEVQTDAEEEDTSEEETEALIERSEKDGENVPTWEDIQQSLKKQFTVISALCNGSNTIAYVTVTDNAGNSSTTQLNLDIDVIAPVIAVEYADKANEGAKANYFTERTATVTITERANHFDAKAATAGIKITAVDAKSQVVTDAYTISDWTTTVDEKDPDATTHTATIKFDKDANYTFAISYTDMANNKADDYSAEAFTVDTTAPTGTLKAVSTEKRSTEWSSLRNALTFGFWSNSCITITGTSDDVTSPVAKVEYYKVKAEKSASEGTVPLTAEELDAVTEWTEFTQLEVKANEQFVVYVKITDNAGNYTYISTNGLIVDDKHPIEESIAPEITVTPEQPVNGIYNGDVKVKIKVDDPLEGAAYSGLKTVDYKIFDMAKSATEPTQSGNLYTFKIAEPKQSELYKTYEGEITVDSRLNNSNDIRIVIYAEDNAANTSDAYETIKIDTTAPVIDISYDNNSADNGTYFKADRTAEIVVTERNFNAEDVKITVTNTDGVIPKISAWTTKEGKGNGDDTTHTATLKYSADGDYTFAIAYTDLAANKCEKINYLAGTVAGTEFTLDKTLPTVAVSYNNNNALNGKYFAANRTATVVVNEHNFDVNRVKFTQTASLNGSTIGGPSISWTNNGDVHTATVNYSADGDYTFDVALTDMAGNESPAANYGSSVAGKDFTIDTKIEKPTISLTGEAAGSAYKGEMIPSVSFSDVNYDSYEIRLIRTRLDDKDHDVTAEFIKGVPVSAQGGSASFNTFESKVENDGIYTLTVNFTDKAGNKESDSVTFTLNRFGSVYVYDDYLCSLIKDGGQFIKSTGNGQPAITKDITITEFNADRLVADSLKLMVTRDGEMIDVKYTTAPSKENINENTLISDRGWFEYVYTISKDNFAEDGVYKITLSSKDYTENESASVPENSTGTKGDAVVDSIKFIVDTTAPEIRNIINLEKNVADKANIIDGKLNVKYSIVDVGGIAKVEVYLNGKVVDTITEFDNGNNFSSTFDIDESNEIQTVRLVITDLAGNVTDTDDESFDPGELYIFNDAVTVSSNAFVRWYRNTPLFWGSIGGTAGAAGILGFIIAKKKKKSDEEE